MNILVLSLSKRKLISSGFLHHFSTSMHSQCSKHAVTTVGVQHSVVWKSFCRAPRELSLLCEKLQGLIIEKSKGSSWLYWLYMSIDEVTMNHDQVRPVTLYIHSKITMSCNTVPYLHSYCTGTYTGVTALFLWSSSTVTLEYHTGTPTE